ncbi:MAG: hypothetical protein H7338_12500 [Candidatus Sericytochromatia bacterium]|nr:hypothetical protein [Candidatus Sericytochromatia bacterium]
MQTLTRWLILAAGVVVLGGPAMASDAPAVPRGVSARVMTQLSGVKPPPGTRLVGGTRIAFSATVTYVAPEDKGTVMVIVQDQSGEPVTTPQPLPVSTRTGKVTFRVIIPVPEDATALTIFTPVMFKGRPSQGAIGHVSYPVVPGPAP